MHRQRPKEAKIPSATCELPEALPESGPRFPLSEPPAPGSVREVAPGMLWARIPLPFRLNHINVYLIADGDGWAIVDTGASDESARAAWETMFAGPLSGFRFTKVIVTHHHLDHIGLAGWLCERFDIPLLTSQTCYLNGANLLLDPEAPASLQFREFYRRHGMSGKSAAMIATRGHDYARMVHRLPVTFRRLADADTITVGDRVFHILTGEGHAPEQVMLYCPEAKVLLAADQVIARISPNIGIWPVEPDGDPLGRYLRSLASLAARLPVDTLVLPGHGLPFYGLHERCRELAAHHRERCEQILAWCDAGACTVADLAPRLFPHVLDPQQRGFAFGETHAHVNHLVSAGLLAWTETVGNLVAVRKTRSTGR